MRFAAQFHRAFLRVLDGIGQQVAQQLADQRGVRVQVHVERVDRQAQSLAGREIGEIAAQLVEQRREIEVGEVDLDRTGLELADVEQAIEQSRHRLDGQVLFLEDLLAFTVANHAPQRAVEQAERLQRLAQIVAGRGEEAALGDVGVLGFAARLFEGLLGLLALADVADRGGDDALVALGDGAQADFHRKLGAVLAHAEQIEAYPHRPHAHVLAIIRTMTRVARAKPVGHQHFHRAAEQLARGIAEQRGDLGVGKQDRAAGVDDDHRVRGRIENAPDHLGGEHARDS